MKLYDHIYKLLKADARLRDSDRMLIWTIWYQQGAATKDYISKDKFIHMAENMETIRRTRQKVQEDHPEVRSSDNVQLFKDQKESTRGNFVYKEHIDTREEVIDFGARVTMLQRAKEELQKKGFHFKSKL